MIGNTIDAVMTAWLGCPGWLQTGALVLLGVIVGAIANHAITTWCWFNRPSSPWAKINHWNLTGETAAVADSLPQRPWWSRVPVFGWIAMRAETPLFGSGFWIRPLCIELSLAAMLPMIHSAYLSGLFLPAVVPPATVAACATWLALIFFVHVGVIGAMVAATFIDFDERTIPDAITLPGTLIGLLIASCSPMIFLPGLELNGVGPVLFYSPETLTQRWMGVTGLLTGIGIWSTYCFAMADRRWIMRRGIVKALAWFWHALTRTGTWKWLLMLWLVGIVVIGAVHWVGNRYWVGLLTSLSGLAVGGGLIWVVRLIGRLALGKEAMGFGDVTLMAMIGTFVGWQAALIAFFLSPMAACVIVLVRWVITREAATPYGPYLCAGVALTVAFWDSVYNRNLRLTLMMLGGNLLWFGVAMALALLAMLWMWRLVKERLIQ